MPCRNDYDNPINPPCNCSEEKKEAKKWEAAFCAIVNQIDKSTGLDITNLLKKASVDSKMELLPLYEEHLKKDMTRLQKDLDKYSNDELSLLYMMLKTKVNGNYGSN